MSSPALTPLQCPFCAASFLPQSLDAQSFTTCPRCSRNMRIGDCALAPAPALEVRHWETQSEQRQAEKSREHAKQSGWVLKAGAGVAVVGGILLYRMMTNSQAPNVTEITAVSATTAEKQEIKLAYAAAKAAVESPDWKGMQQHVLATDRVGPLMHWFYAKHPQGYQVRKVSGIDHEVIDLVHQPSTATLRLLTNDGVLHVLLQKTEQGWKLDWESFSNVYSVLWAAFLNGEPDLPKELPMPLEIESCPRSTLVPSWFTNTGIDPANIGRAVRLYIAHPTNVGAACWDENNAAGKDIAAALATTSRPLKWILQVELLNAKSYPPAVTIKSVIKHHWDNAPLPRPDEP